MSVAQPIISPEHATDLSEITERLRARFAQMVLADHPHYRSVVVTPPWAGLQYHPEFKPGHVDLFGLGNWWNWKVCINGSITHDLSWELTRFAMAEVLRVSYKGLPVWLRYAVNEETAPLRANVYLLLGAQPVHITAQSVNSSPVRSNCNEYSEFGFELYDWNVRRHANVRIKFALKSWLDDDIERAVDDYIQARVLVAMTKSQFGTQLPLKDVGQRAHAARRVLLRVSFDLVHALNGIIDGAVADFLAGDFNFVWLGEPS